MAEETWHHKEERSGKANCMQRAVTGLLKKRGVAARSSSTCLTSRSLELEYTGTSDKLSLPNHASRRTLRNAKLPVEAKVQVIGRVDDVMLYPVLNPPAFVDDMLSLSKNPQK